MVRFDGALLIGVMTAIGSSVACANGASSTTQYSGFISASGAFGTEAGEGDGGAGDDVGTGSDGPNADDGGPSGQGAVDDAGNDGGGSPTSNSGNDEGGTTGAALAGSGEAGGPADAAASAGASDKCARYSDTCGDCTQGRTGYNCGWCNGCFTGTSSGPASTGVCAGATWIWKSSSCP